MSRLFLISFLFLTLGSAALESQDSKESKDCHETAMTQSEMNRCADQDAIRADKDLNAIYQNLLKLMANDPRAIAKLKAQENAWIHFRDAFLDAAFPAEDKQANYGTMYPMEALELRAQLTRDQANRLRGLSDRNN